jgi:hypothetical protein
MKRAAVVGTLCAAYAGMASIHLAAPYFRHHEGICAAHSVHARNHLVHGVSATRLGNLELGGTDLSVYEDWRDDFYPNRPPLSILGPAVFFAAFGPHEGVFRLNLILVGVATLLVFSGIARRLLAAPWDLVATGLFALAPVFAYFSHVATHLAYGVFFSLLAWYACLRWEDGRRFRVLTFAALFLACLSDWPGYFAALSIAARRFRGLRSPVSWGALGVALGSFALHLAHLRWLAPDGRLIKRFLVGGADRSLLVSPPLGAYLLEEGREILLYFTGGAAALAVLGAVAFARRRQWTPFFLLLLGLEEAVFTYLAYWHDFLTYPLVAFVAIAAAEGAARAWERRTARWAAAGLLLAAAAQSVWVGLDLHTRRGPYDSAIAAAVAIRGSTSPRDRVLLALPDQKRPNHFYSERWVASREAGIDRLSVRHGGPYVRIPDDGALVRHLEERPDRYDVVVLDERPPGDPLRDALDRKARSRSVQGSFVFYRLR